MGKDKLIYTLLLCVLLGGVTFVAFEQVRQNEFVHFDDDKYITGNEHVTSGLNVKNIVWAFTKSHSANWHPLTWLSHMLDCQLFALEAGGHHMVNLLFHIANTVLLFLVFQMMTGAIWPSFFVAAAFAVHPAHVESVAWASERKDVLSTFFWMLTMAAYVQYTKRPGVKKYLLVVVCFCLGLMSKPMLVTLPFVLLLLDWWPLERFRPEEYDDSGVGALRLIAEKIPLFTLAAASSVITYIVQQKEGAVEGWPVGLRISHATVGYLRYIGKIFYPTRLAILYPFQIHGFPLWQVIASAVILVFISLVVIEMVRQTYGRRWLLMGWLWYLGVLFPVSGLVHIGNLAIADRYTYLSSIGIFIMIAWAAAEFTFRRRSRKIVTGILGVLVITGMVIGTRLQVRHWRNDFTLFGHAIEVTKNNYVMHNNLGGAFRLAGKYDEAARHYHKALEIAPYHVRTYCNMGHMLKLQGKFDEAVAYFHQALAISGDYVPAHSELGDVYYQQGKLQLAAGYYYRILALEGDRADVLSKLGWILAVAPDAEVVNAADAVKFATSACELTDYNNAEMMDSLAAAYAAAGEFTKAVQTAQKATKLAEAAGRNDLAQKIRSRLELYNNGKRYQWGR